MMIKFDVNDTNYYNNNNNNNNYIINQNIN